MKQGYLNEENIQHSAHKKYKNIYLQLKEINHNKATLLYDIY